MHFVSPLFAIVFSFILFIRFAESRKQTDALNRNLESRIEAKIEELKLTHQQITNLERQQAASNERDRITRDMHDGLGGYLAGALALVENDTINRDELLGNLLDANEEMRLLIDIADSENNLSMAIGSMREKLQRILNAADIKLLWDIQVVREGRSYSNDMIVNITRIIQECVSNAIKHSNAKQVKISLNEYANGAVDVRIADDGICRGIIRENGHGIGNIRSRSQAIGGEVVFYSNGELGGLAVKVVIPSQVSTTVDEQSVSLS